MSAIPKASINDLISASQPPSGQMTGGNDPMGNFINLLAKYAQPVEQGIQNIPQDITRGVNYLGSQVNNLSPMPGVMPTVGQVADTINKVLADQNTGLQIPFSDALHNQATPTSLILSAGMLAGGGENPEDIANETDKPLQDKPTSESPQSGTQYARDMRYKQGTDNPNAFKEIPSTQAKGTNPDTAVPPQNPGDIGKNGNASNDQNTTSANPAAENDGLPPIDTNPLGTNAAGGNANTANQARFKRTYSPGNETPVDTTNNTNRNLQYAQDGIQTPKQKAQVNATLNGYRITGTLDRQLQGIDDQKGILSKAAQTQVEQDGGTSTKEELRKSVIHDVSYNGSKHTISSIETPNAVDSYLNNAYVRATGGDPTTITGNTMPENVPDTIVQKMKSIMSQDASNTFIKDPSTWTKFEQIARYARNSFNTILDTKHPEASTLNNDMSDLYDAQESIMKGANKESAEAFKAQSEALKNTQGQPSGFWGKTGKVALGLGEAGVGLAGLKTVGIDVPSLVNTSIGTLGQLGQGAYNYMTHKPGQSQLQNPSNDIGNTKNNNTNTHNQSVSYSYNNVKPDKNGDYQATIQTQPGGVYMSDSQRRLNEQGLTAGTPAYTQIEQEYKDSQDKASALLTPDKMNYMTNAPRWINGGNALKGEMSQLPTDIWNGIGAAGSIKAYMSTNANSPYAQELSDIDNFNNLFSSAYKTFTGVDPTKNQLIGSAKSPEQNKEIWNRMQQFMVGTHKDYLDPYLAKTSPSGIQTETGAIPTNTPIKNNSGPVSFPSNPNMMQSNFPNLPPIGSIPTQ